MGLPCPLVGPRWTTGFGGFAEQSRAHRRAAEKLDRRRAAAAVENVVDTIVRAVHKGDSVTITGFGVFEQRRRAARVARNPRTGETVKVEASVRVAFPARRSIQSGCLWRQRLPAEGPAVKRGVTAGGRAKKAVRKAVVKKAVRQAAVKKASERQPARRPLERLPPRRPLERQPERPLRRLPPRRPLERLPPREPSRRPP